jgi:hypothetical protein
MTRTRQSLPTLDRIFGEFAVEDRATEYLAGFPKDVAAVIAVRTAVELASIWEIEKRCLSRRDDPRLVCHSGAEERHVLYSAAAARSQDPLWSEYSDDSYAALFSRLTPDTAARIAYIVARRTDYLARLK